jgi:hypothetical protein
LARKWANKSDGKRKNTREIREVYEKEERGDRQRR